MARPTRKSVITPQGVRPGNIMLPPPATPVDITKTEDAWSKYTLEDGSVLSVKPVIAEVRRVKGGYNENGDPLYMISTTLVVRTSAPEKLKQKLK